MKKNRFPLLLLLLSFLFISPLIPDNGSIKDSKKKVEAFGRVKFKQNVPVKFLGRNEMKAYIGEWFEREYPRELVEKEALFIRLMGFVDGKPTDIREQRKRVLMENTGGVYNEKNGELLVLEEDGNTDSMNNSVIVHELRHAIQDQHLDLHKLLSERPPSDFDDRRLSLLAALEGDATFIMLQVSDFDSELLQSDYASDSLLSYSPTGNYAQLSSAPEIIKQQFIMPYLEGVKFIDAIFQKKKWDGISLVMRELPLSSEQILHPEKYLAKEKPLAVTIDSRPAGFTLVHAGVIGEFYLNILLKASGRYIDQAEGWGGDQFEIFSNAASGKTCLLWESVWDKEDYCNSFYQEFKRFIEKKFGFDFRQGKTKDIDFIAGNSGNDYFFIHKTGNRIFYVRSDDRTQINDFIRGGHYD